MGTTNTTSGSNSSQLQFNPIAQGVYNNLQGGAGNVLGGYLNSPFSNSFYNLGAAQSQKGAQQAGANNMGALNQNMLTSGLSGQAGAGFKQAQMAQTGRSNQAMSSQANIQNVLSALQRQMGAAGTAMSYSPQLTGQSGNFNQTQSQSGLGTWLPQLLGAGLGAATMRRSGGMGGLGGMSGASAAAAMPSNLSSIMSPGTWGSITGMPMPGMAGMGSGGMGGMMPGAQGAPNPFMNSMFYPQ